MSEENARIFRKKSIEQLSAPEDLMDYLRVTGPGIWLVVIGIAALLVGLIVWAVTGSINTYITVPAQVENGVIHCYVLQEDMKESEDEIEIWVGDQEMTAQAEDNEDLVLDTKDAPALYETGYLKAGKNVVVVSAPTNLKDGFYQADLVLSSVQPMKLLFGRT